MEARNARPVFLIAGLVLCGAPAWGAEPVEGLSVGGSGSCPAPDAVKAALSELISEKGRRALPAGARVEVDDRGGTFTVVVTAEGKSARRAYADAPRDCERRVRFAAVFTVTTLLPPELALAAEPTPKVEPAPPRAPEPTLQSRPPPRDEPAPVLRLELGAFGEAGVHFAEPTWVLSWGGELRAALGDGPFAGTLGITYAPQAALSAPELDADLARITVTAGVRRSVIERPVLLALDIGLIGAFERLEGTELLTPAYDTALELGFRAGLVVGLRRTRGVQPFVGVHAACFPVPRELSAAPRGVAAHTPLIWMGATLGIALGL